MSAMGRAYALKVVENALQDPRYRDEWNNLTDAEKEEGLRYFESVYDGAMKIEEKNKETK